MELSEERKKQIRAEEEAKLRAAKEAEQKYRDEVRKELEGQQEAQLEQQYREEVRAELAETSQPPSAETTPTPPPTAEPAAPTQEAQPPAPAAPEAQVPAAPPQVPVEPVAPAEAAPPPAPAPPQAAAPVAQPPPPAPAAVAPAGPSQLVLSRFLKPLIAGILVVGGLTCAGLAFTQGYVWPFTRPPAEIVLNADDSGELETVADEFSAEPASRVSMPTGGGTTPSDSKLEEATDSGTKRASLPGTGISIEVPSGWVVEPNDFEDLLEIRWRDSGVESGREEVVAYVLLQKMELREGETLDDFAKRLVEEFKASTTPDDRIKYERDEEIANFHGVRALTVDVVSSGYLPYRMRDIFWVKDGSGYELTCYATAGTFEDREPTFKRMLESMRLSGEAR